MNYTLQFLCIRANHKKYALDIKRIIEVARIGSEGYMAAKGGDGEDVIIYGKMQLPLRCLAGILFGIDSPPSENRRVLILEFGGQMTGLLVDSVEEILRIGRDQIGLPEKVPEDLANEFYEGVIKTDEENIYILSFEKLGRMIKV